MRDGIHEDTLDMIERLQEENDELRENNKRMRECLEWWLRTAEDSGWSSSAVSIKLALGMEVSDEEQGLY